MGSYRMGALSSAPDKHGIRRDLYLPRGAAARQDPQHLLAMRQVFRRAALALRRIIIPVLLLLDVLGAITLCAGAPSGIEGYPVGAMLTPAAFLVIQLTNRRYGPSYALAQLGTSLALGGIALLSWRSQPLTQEAVANALAFILSGVASIAMFEGMRGPRWWTAPLAAAVASAVLFPLVSFPIQFAATAEAWIRPMLSFTGMMLAESLLLLLPFWLLRSVVPPVDGLGGY